MRFKKRIKSEIKEIREKIGLSQKELAEKVGVSRQTIYFIEKGESNPTLTLSFEIAKVLKKSVDKLFYAVPIINDLIGSSSYDKLKEIANNLDITLEKLTSLSEIDEKQLNDEFNKELLIKISRELGCEFEDLFED